MVFKDDEIYTSDEVIEKLKISRETLYRYIKSGKLKAKKIGKGYRFIGKELNRFLGVEDNDGFSALSS